MILHFSGFPSVLVQWPLLLILFHCFFLLYLSVRISQGLVSRPFLFLNYHPYYLSFTQQNLIQTHMPSISKFLIPLLTFSLNSRLTYPSSTYHLNESLIGISCSVASLIVSLVLSDPVLSPGLPIFLLNDLAKKPGSFPWFFSFCNLPPPFSLSYNL